jgi:hypothetical protein
MYLVIYYFINNTIYLINKVTKYILQRKYTPVQVLYKILILYIPQYVDIDYYF